MFGLKKIILSGCRTKRGIKKMDLNEKHNDLFIPQWFAKSNFEDMIDKTLTDKQFKIVKDYLINSAGDYIAESISERIREELNEMLKAYPEILN
jgi:hypothetical protein